MSPEINDGRDWGYFANGDWHAPANGQMIDSINPTTAQVWARVADCDASDVDRAVAAAQAAFAKGPFASMRATERGRLLSRMADAVRRNADRLARAETLDNGKLLSGMQGALTGWLVDSFDYYAGLADKIEGAVIPVDAPDVFNYTRRAPYGVVACITTWNSPLLIAIWKMSAAIAAGNTVVLKPSELASVSTLVLMDVLAEADLPPGMINVVTGGIETGVALVRHPNVHLISFTGGGPGGSAVADVAAETVKPLILELGGKSPQLVLEDADVELAARGIVGGIFPPAGQSCIAGSRVLVHHSLHDALVARLVALSEPARIGDPSDPQTQMAPMANQQQYNRVLASIAQGKADGATCVLGGNAAHPHGCGGWFIEPTIFTDVTPEMSLARDEVFGPVLAVMPVQDETEAIALANHSDFGLAAGIWTTDSLRAMRLADRVNAGTVYINTYFGSAPQSPVGGFKQSGYGRENGIEGLLAFTQTKSIWLATEPAQPEPFG